MGGKERALVAFQALRSVHDNALPGDQLGQCVGLAFDARGPLGIYVDQAAAGVLAAERVTGWHQPALRLFVEDDEILGGRNADDDLAQLAPFMMDAKVHVQTRA